MMIRFDRNI